MRSLFIPVLAVAILSSAVSYAQEAVRVPDVGEGRVVDAGDPVVDRISRSSSRQFIVRGKDARVRAAFCVFSEEVKTELLALLRQHDRWSYPVVIAIHGSTTAINVGSPVRSRLFKKAGGGYRLQADVELSQSFTREVMRTELIRLLLAEEVLRSHPKAEFTGRRGVVPEWLRVGVAEAIEFRRRGRPTELFASIFKSGKMMSVAEMIHPKDSGSDSVSSAIYKASCCGFVLSLVGQDDGPTRLRKMIGDLAVFKGTPKALLEKHFPGNGDSANSLEKWWALELATMAQPTVKDILDPLATEQALGRCLQARFIEKVGGEADGGNERKGRKKFWQIFRSENSSEEGSVSTPMESSQVTVVDITEFRSFVERDDRAQILGDIEVKLLQLSYRAFPLHRPLIREYQEVLNLLARDKIKGVDDRLAELAAARIAISRSTGDATDYLNWYEATQVGRHSGAFTDYKDAVEELRKPPPPRTDPLSEYLDELDKEFGGG